MISTARRHLSVYVALFGMIPKLFMAYQIWFWVGLVLNVISMAILVFFWIDRIFVVQSQISKINTPFALGISLFILLYTVGVLFSGRDYFSR